MAHCLLWLSEVYTEPHASCCSWWLRGLFAMTILHSHPIWLPQTQSWMYTQVTELQRLKIDAHVACEKIENGGRGGGGGGRGGAGGPGGGRAGGGGGRG